MKNDSVKRHVAQNGSKYSWSDPRRAPEKSDFMALPDGQNSTANLPDKPFIQAMRYEPTLAYMKE